MGGKAGDAKLVAHGFGKRLAEHDANVFDGVVCVDLEISLRLHGEVEQSMARERIEHVIEERDARVDIGLARAVDLEREQDVGFFRGARDGCGS